MEDTRQFDPEETLDENFPIITKPDKYEFNLEQCSLDLKDKETPLTFYVAKSQYEEFWMSECHQIQFLIVDHMQDMANKGKLVDDNGEILSLESPQVKKFFNSDAVKFTLKDQSLFDQMYQYIDEMQNTDYDETPEDGQWIRYYDEEDKRVYYKQEEGKAYGTVMCDSVTNAGLTETLACYDNLTLLELLMKEFYDLKFVKRPSPGKGLCYGKQSFPWPMWHRDIAFYFSGASDYKNRICLTLSTSLDPGTSYYGSKVPEEDTDNFVRLDILQGFNLFQYLGPRKTRHIQIMNSDPKIDYIPSFLLNYMMKSVLYSNIQGLQDTSEQMHNPEYEHYHLMQDRESLYGLLHEEITTGGKTPRAELMKKWNTIKPEHGPFDMDEEEKQNE